MDRHIFLTALALSGALLAADVTAAPISLNLTGGTTTNGIKSFAIDGVNVTASGWADTGGYWSDDKLRRGNVQTWSSGIGVCNQDEGYCSSPEHAIDNYSDHDMVQLTFSKAVVLDAFQLGWIYNDSDVTLLAWTGIGSYDLNGKEWGDLIDDGWTAVADFFDGGTSAVATGATIASTQWLIGAYNDVFDAPDVDLNNYTRSGYDKVKLRGIAFSVPEEPPHEVPEPGSLALFALGALGLVAARRRRS